MKYRRHLSILLLGLLVPAGIFAWYWRSQAVHSDGIEANGGQSLTLAVMPEAPYYRQADPAWGGDHMGGQGETMARSGCTVCCLSMAFTHLGFSIDPKTLNAKLKEQDGYNRSGWLKWQKAADLTDRTIAIEIPAAPSHAAIDAALQAGNLVVAKIILWNQCQHWVLIVGKEGTEYLVKDPLCGAEKITRLSTLTRQIQAIRIVKKPPTTEPGKRNPS